MKHVQPPLVGGRGGCTTTHTHSGVGEHCNWVWFHATENICVHVCSVIETRQCNSTTCTPKDNSSFFRREKEELPEAGFKPAVFCMLGRHSTN